MEIRRLSLIGGAEQAQGLAVVIDVFRAFSTAAYVMSNGAEKIIPVGTVEEAFEMKRKYHCVVLMGEREGKQNASAIDRSPPPTAVAVTAGDHFHARRST